MIFNWNVWGERMWSLRPAYNELISKKEVTEKEILNYIFRECLAVRARVLTQGTAKGHNYSGLLIRFAGMLRAQLPQDQYDFFRKAFGLPINGTLTVYSNADSCSPDGQMVESICQAAQLLKEEQVRSELLLLSFSISCTTSHFVKNLTGRQLCKER